MEIVILTGFHKAIESLYQVQNIRLKICGSLSKIFYGRKKYFQGDLFYHAVDHDGVL
jgi:hypothetical protein